MGIGRPECYLLALFGVHVHQAWGHTPYHVGSSLTQKRGWRDVDVRLILPDKEFAVTFGDPLAVGWAGQSRISMHELAWSTLGRKMTRLPIDFQIQQQTLANQIEGPRSALMLLSSDLPLVQDALTSKRKRRAA